MEKVLKHGRYIMGPEIDTLEKRLCDLVGVKYTISCSSGTDALVMALMAGGIGPGDAVFTTPFTFFATAEAISMVGATPVFVDIDPETFNISPRNLADAIRAVREDNNAIYPLPDYRGKDAPLSPKAVIAVDLFGLPCDYDALSTIADDNGLLLIEDAAQSLGGAYKGKQAGALGDMGCTSFFPAKPLGCYGDGGAVFTDSDTLAAKLRSIRVHGMGGHKYDNERIGLNARLDTLQAAVLLAKLDIFDEENQLRRQRARTYFDLLNPACPSLFLPSIPKGCVSAWAQYSILAQNTDMRTRIIDGLDKKGIPTMIYYQKPLHLQEAYGGLGYEKVSMPVAEKISSKIFSIPMHPYLDEETIKKVSRAIMDYAQG
ncbi:MAG: DegT/DnrJ/EryC1/StrS family aminotransferase [Desulfobacter sp.]|nr:MAG: DegT/DnrJ/EryC1/StrS family aminotransferase [Desulfobacter sp.]